MNTTAPVPVSSVSALARFAEEGVPSHVATPLPREESPVPPEPAANGVMSVKTPALLKLEVAVAPKYAPFNAEKSVVEALSNFCNAVHVFAFPIFKAQSLTAALPLYEVPLSDPLTVCAFRLLPRDMPEMVEFVSPVLSSVPVTVGVNIRAEALGTIVCPKVSPLKLFVVLEKVMVAPVVVAKPDPREVSLLLNVVQSAEAKHPKTEPEAVSHVTAPPEYVNPVENVVVAVHVGMLLSHARICPPVP